VIPRGGYRLDDMIDDMPGASLAANPSAEGWMAPDCRDRASVEVREPAVIY
jgi:hypothetical protein